MTNQFELEIYEERFKRFERIDTMITLSIIFLLDSLVFILLIIAFSIMRGFN